MTDFEFIYVGDPMCSWCWGFSPVMERLAERFGFPTLLIVGGLRPGPASEVLDDRMRRFLEHHWVEIGERTGQPFDLGGLDRQEWIYDTLLPDTAAVTMRQIRPDEALRFFARLQRAFYAEAMDVTDSALYPELLEGFDVDPDRFLEALASEEMQQRTYGDFARARALGADGFPTLFLRVGDEIFLVSRGYAPYEMLEPALAEFTGAALADDGERV